MEEIGNESNTKTSQKSYFDVLGMCCSSEAALVENILKSLEGIQKISVIVPSKTVIVVHDNTIITQLQIVHELNQAKLEASVRSFGATKVIKKWPSPYILTCGLLLLVSMLKPFFHPLKWFAIAAAVAGLPPIVFRSIAAIKRFTLDINILLLIAVAGAVALGDYSESGFIVFLFTIAEWLESVASLKATAGMSSLMSLAPQKAVLAENGQVVDAQDVKVNTVLAVKAGEVIPIDGVVVEGSSEVDERSLTGEPYPVTKEPQSLVWAGTININGYISVKTTALAENSAVAKMTRLVEEAQNRRSKTQRLIDACAKYYTPAVVAIAAGVAIVPLIKRVSDRKQWFKLALVLLVSACPCALVLSTPVATFCALLKAARTGLLIKGGDVLEAMARIKIVAFDKTGTITKGEFTVIEFRSFSSNLDLPTVLYWVSSIESKSSHPMASAIVSHAKSLSIQPKPDNVREFQIYPGEGIHGEIDGKKIYIGNRRIAARALCEQISVPSMENGRGLTYGYIFVDAEAVGVFTLSDTCRTGAAQALKDLKRLGIKTAMLTGDTNEASLHAQNQLENGIGELHAELLPQDKVRLIEELKRREGPTAMVGDGMNDAPALAMADVGISMGISGSAVAMETSHITLMSNDIRKIAKAIRLAKKTYYKIVVNILFSVITKAVIVALAVAGHPLLWAAVLADVGTCLVVILNSMILLQTRTSEKEKCCGSNQKSPTGCEKDSSNCKGLKDNHSCHAHEYEVNECSNHHHHHEETSHHSSCCQELAELNENENQEHLVSVVGANSEKTSVHKHSNPIVYTEEKHHDGHETVTCNNKSNAEKDCCKNHHEIVNSTNICKGADKQKIVECCLGDHDECVRKRKVIRIIERRANGCCRYSEKSFRNCFVPRAEELPV